MQGIYCFIPFSSSEPLELLKQHIPSAEDPIVFFYSCDEKHCKYEVFFGKAFLASLKVKFKEDK